MTQERKWTPGPWRAGPSHTVRFEWRDEQNRSCISWIADCVGGHPPGEIQANAHLIASAPELYGALEDIMVGGNHLALLIGADHPPHTAKPDEALAHYGPGNIYEIWCCWQAIMKARAALSKARGEQS